MDFAGILKDSWKITWKKKNLWWLGFFALITEAGSSSPSFYQLPALPTSEDKAKAAATGIFSSASSVFSNPALITIAVITILAIFIIMLYISYSAKAGLILAVDKYGTDKLDNKPVAKKFFAQGSIFAWRIFLFNLILAVVVAFILALLIAPTVPLILALDRAEVIFMFIGLLLVASAAIIVFSIGITIIKELGERMIVLDQKSVTRAIAASIRMMFANIGNILLTWLISLAVGIGFGLASFLAFFFAGLVYFVTSASFYLLLKTPGLIFFGTTSGLIIVLLVCAVLGAFSTFTSSYWTLSYKQFAKEN